MKLLSGLSLAHRLLLGFAAMLTLLIALAVLSLSRMNSLSNALEKITVENAARGHAIAELSSNAGKYVQALGDLGSGDLSDGESIIKRVDKVLTGYDEAQAKLSKLLPADPLPQALLTTISENSLAARELLARGAKRASKRGDAARAFYTRHEYSQDTKGWSAKQLAWTEAISALGQWGEQAEAELARDTTAGAATARIVIIAGSLAALIVGGLLAVWIIRDTKMAIDAAVRATRTMAAHDLSQPIANDRRDEIGGLLDALEHMRLNLHELASGVRHSCAGITHASGEIAQGSMELSSRTESAASTLQSTVGTIAQLTESVNQTSASARSAHTLADDASTVANQGGAVVLEAVGTMGEINTASHKIADIISIIDGIAFQTNILALNAAVEAARAGEQGRGFAVVATEVRALAGRSASAAREIKTLIEDSLAKVESGTEQVGRAGNTTHEIVASVERVSSIIDSITNEAEQQRGEIAQANESVAQLDRDVQQNAALAEQSAAAAATLREQAEHLTQLVGRFALSSQEATHVQTETA